MPAVLEVERPWRTRRTVGTVVTLARERGRHRRHTPARARHRPCGRGEVGDVIVDKAIYRNGRREGCGDLSDELRRAAPRPGRLPLDRPQGPDRRGVRPRQRGAAPAPAGRRGRRPRPPAGQDRAVRGVGCSSCSRPCATSRRRATSRPARSCSSSATASSSRCGTARATRWPACASGSRPNPSASATARSTVLHAVMDSVVDNYTVVDREVRQDLEQHRGAGLRRDPRRRRRRRSTGSSARCSSSAGPASRSPTPWSGTSWSRTARRRPDVPEVLLPFFRDVADHLRLVNDHVESYDRLLTDVLGAHLAQISRRSRTSDMRRISAWVAIAAVPDDDRRHLRHELPAHPRARAASSTSAARSSTTATSSCSRVMAGACVGPLPGVQALRLAVATTNGRLPPRCDRPFGASRRRQVALMTPAASTPTSTRPERDAVPDERHQGVGRDEAQQPGDRGVGDDEGDDDADEHGPHAERRRPSPLLDGLEQAGGREGRDREEEAEAGSR